MLDIDNEELLKHIKKSCDTCRFCSNVCMEVIKNPTTGEEVYGMPIERAKAFYPEGCDRWMVSIYAFGEYCEKEGLI